MLNFVAKYVTSIEECKDGTLLIEYYPEGDLHLAEVKRLKRETDNDRFRRCLKQAIRVTDAIFGNRDWEVLGFRTAAQRKAYNKNKASSEKGSR